MIRINRCLSKKELWHTCNLRILFPFFDYQLYEDVAEYFLFSDATVGLKAIRCSNM